MSKDTLGIILAVVVGVMGFAIWLADKYGKATPTLTAMVLLIMAGLCLCGVYLIPWLWNAETLAEKIWRPASATALVLIAIGYFGVWVSRPHAADKKDEKREVPAQTEDIYSPNYLAQMAPFELQLQTQVFAGKLRLLGKKWDDEYTKNNQTWMECDKSSKSQQEKEICGSQRMADNQRSLRELHQQFKKEYFRDAIALAFELNHRVGQVVMRGGGPTTGPGYTEPPLPIAPPLLSADVAAGSNPFNEAADYFENLAKRLH